MFLWWKKMMFYYMKDIGCPISTLFVKQLVLLRQPRKHQKWRLVWKKKLFSITFIGTRWTVGGLLIDSTNVSLLPVCSQRFNMILWWFFQADGVNQNYVWNSKVTLFMTKLNLKKDSRIFSAFKRFEQWNIVPLNDKIQRYKDKRMCDSVIRI